MTWIYLILSSDPLSFLYLSLLVSSISTNSFEYSVHILTSKLLLKYRHVILWISKKYKAQVQGVSVRRWSMEISRARSFQDVTEILCLPRIISYSRAAARNGNVSNSRIYIRVVFRSTLPEFQFVEKPHYPSRIASFLRTKHWRHRCIETICKTTGIQSLERRENLSRDFVPRTICSKGNGSSGRIFGVSTGNQSFHFMDEVWKIPCWQWTM